MYLNLGKLSDGNRYVVVVCGLCVTDRTLWYQNLAITSLICMSQYQFTCQSGQSSDALIGINGHTPVLTRPYLEISRGNVEFKLRPRKPNLNSMRRSIEQDMNMMTVFKRLENLGYLVRVSAVRIQQGVRALEQAPAGTRTFEMP
jgi:hypothetical protein